jgi:hypothetical protein
MHDNKNIDGVREVSLDQLINGLMNNDRLTLAQARMKALEDAGDRLAFLMLNGTTSEMKPAIWQWRELNPRKENNE